MKIYHFPPITLNRLVRESVSGFYLRRIKFPDPDRPFTALDRRRCLGPPPPIRLGGEGNALYLDVDTYRLLTRRASNFKMTELNGPLRQLNPLSPLTRAHG
jgi:hypothetical protein